MPSEENSRRAGINDYLKVMLRQKRMIVRLTTLSFKEQIAGLEGQGGRAPSRAWGRSRGWDRNTTATPPSATMPCTGRSSQRSPGGSGCASSRTRTIPGVCCGR